MTQLVNVKTAKHFDVYIGRPSYAKASWQGADGYFGNPYCISKKVSRVDAINLYRKYFSERIVKDAEFRRRIKELRGKVIACWCHPQPCHGDIIVDYLNLDDVEEKRNV